MPRDDGVTVALPVCDEHPPLSTWPTANLIRGVCPVCGGLDHRPAGHARMLRARQLIAERDDG